MFAASNLTFSADYKVLFDATSNGSAGTSSNTINASWSHTASGNYRVVIVVVTVLTTANANYSSHSRTVTYGGIDMISLGGIHANNNNNYPFVEGFYLFNPPLGSQTVSVTYSRASTSYRRMCAVALSYTGCRGVYGLTTDFGTESGTALSQTVSSLTSDVLVQGFLDYQALWSGSIGSYNQTQRYSLAAAGGNADNAMVVGDALGTGSSVTFTATRYTGSAYAEFCLKLTSVFTPFNMENVSTTGALIPPGVSGCYVTLIGGGGGGGLGSAGAFSQRGGGGGGGGGAKIERSYFSLGDLGPTFSVATGVGGVSGTDGTDSVFSSGGITLTAGAGLKGTNGGTDAVTNAAGGGGGTASVVGATGITTANGTAGGGGGTGGGGNAIAAANNTSGGAPGGGGGGGRGGFGNVGKGAAGGNSATVNGGAGATSANNPGGAGNNAAAGNAGGGGGGGAGSNSNPNAAVGGVGGAYGAGGGGSAGGNYTAAGGAGASGYALIEWV